MRVGEIIAEPLHPYTKALFAASLPSRPDGRTSAEPAGRIVAVVSAVGV